MHYLIARKCQLAFERSNPTSEKLRTYTTLLQKIKENDLVISAIDAVIPKNNLRNLEFSDVMRLREAFSSPLKEFRAYLLPVSIIGMIAHGITDAQTVPPDGKAFQKLPQKSIL